MDSSRLFNSLAIIVTPRGKMIGEVLGISSFFDAQWFPEEVIRDGFLIGCLKI